MGSPNYGLGWPQQHDHIQFLATNFNNPTGFQPQRNESGPVPGMFPSSMAFHGTARYQAGNEVAGDSDNVQSSLAFHSTGYQAGNVVTGGYNQLAPSVEFYGAGYHGANAVHGGSNQRAPLMGFRGTGYQAANAVHGGSNQFAPFMGFHGTGYQAANAVHGGSNQLAPSMEFYGAGYLAGNAVNNDSGPVGYGFFSPPEFGRVFNGNFAPWMINMQQGIRTTPMTSGPSQVVGNVAKASHAW